MNINIKAPTTENKKKLAWSGMRTQTRGILVIILSTKQRLETLSYRSPPPTRVPEKQFYFFSYLSPPAEWKRESHSLRIRLIVLWLHLEFFFLSLSHSLSHTLSLYLCISVSLSIALQFCCLFAFCLSSKISFFSLFLSYFISLLKFLFLTLQR